MNGLAGILCAAFSFLAFVPPPAYVLDQWTDQSRKVKSIHIKQKTTVFTEGRSEGTAVDEEIWIRRPGLFRKTSTFGDKTAELIVGAQAAGRYFQGKFDVGAPVDVMGVLGILYSYDDPKRITSIFRQAGFLTDVSRWVLDNRIIQMEIGEAGGKRIRFKKTEWVPSGAEIGGRSYRFLTAVPSRFPIPYPEAVELLEGPRLIERTEVISVKIDETLPDSLFDVSRLRPGSKKK